MQSFDSKKTTRSVARNAIISALYVVLTLLSHSFSYGMIQFRIAEILVLICFFRRDTIFGLVVGCFIANAFSTIAGLDMLFGTLATLIACLGITFMPRLLLAIFWPIAANAFIVGAEVFFILGEGQHYFVAVGWVALGETVVLIAGYLIFLALKQNKGFMKMIGANRRVDVKW